MEGYEKAHDNGFHRAIAEVEFHPFPEFRFLAEKGVCEHNQR